MASENSKPAETVAKSEQQRLALFLQHLEEASRIVQTWPEWKRNILGPVIPKQYSAPSANLPLK